MNTLDQVMNGGEPADNPMQNFTATVLELTATVQEAMRLLTEEAQKLSAHEHILADADKPGHFMMGLGFEYDSKTKRHNVVGSFSFNEEMRKLEERINVLLEDLQAAVDGKIGSLSSNIYIPLPDAGLPQPTEAAFRLPAGAGDGDGADVAELGRFVWSATSIAPVDSETCLLAVGKTEAEPGRWLLAQPSLSMLLSVLLRFDDFQDVQLGDTTKRIAAGEAALSELRSAVGGMILSGSGTLTFPNVPASGGVGKAPLEVPGAQVGDAVVVVPPATLVDGFVCSGVVTAEGVVSVCLTNCKTSAMTPVSGEYRAFSITSLRSQPDLG